MTTDNRKIQLETEVVDNTKPGFDSVKNSAASMAQGVEQSAAKAAKAVDGIGNGADAGAQKLDRSTKSIISSVQRATAAMEAGERGTAKYFETLAGQRGANVDAIKPYLEQLKQAERAQQVATGSLDKMGVSAAQTAAALRGVPAQFTDIVTSLQGGQAPLTVFLQQGGQLRDMFGGAGTAARALGGYVVGLINPFTLAAAAVGGLAFAYNQGSKEADAYRAALVTTGNAAGTNAAQLKSYAQEISSVVGTQGKAAEALSALAATGKVGAENLREAAQAAVAYERATGQAASKTAEQFAAFRNEPLSAVLKLNDGMNFLTESTYRQIKSLEEQGKTAEAANVAQRAFADTLSGRAGEMERNLGTVERGWLAVKDAAKSAWDAILNVGRASTSVDQLADVRKQIAARENQLANDGFGSNGGGAAFGRPSSANSARLSAELTALKAQAAALEGVAYASKAAAEAERQRGESVRASAAFDKAGEKLLTDKVKMERELAVARTQGAEAGRSQADIEKRLNEIRASYAKKGGSSVASENKELRDQQRIFAELAGVSSTYYAELANYQKQRAAGVVTEAQYTAAVEKLIQKQPFAVALAKEEAEAAKVLTKAHQEAAAERLKIAQSMEKSADAFMAQNQAMREEIELIGLSTDQQTVVLQQRNDVIILTKEATLAELERQSAISGTQTRVEIALAAEIDALKERNELLGAKGVKNAAVDAAKTAADEWKKTADSINNTLTDALMRGFESGKDFAKNMRDTIVNMFKTMVLRPVINAIINPIAGAAAGALGFSGAASAAGGGGSSVLGTASNLLSAGNSLGLLGAAGQGLSAFTGALTAGAQSLVGLTGTTAQMTASLQAAGYWTGSAASTAATTAGASAGSMAAQAIPYVGAALLAANALGLFRSNKQVNQGIKGTLGYDSDLTAFEQWRRGGTLFSGPKYSDRDKPLDGKMADAMGQSVRGIYTAGEQYAQVLGLSTDGARSVTRDIRVETKGLTDAQVQEKLQIEFNALGESIAQSILGAAQAEVEKAGETSGQTLARLATSLTVVNSVFDMLGTTALNASLASGDLASKLADASGGLEAMVAKAQAYYAAYYSETERLERSQKDIARALRAVNAEMPRTKDEFRQMVEALDLNTEAGRAAYATLMQVAPAFAEVSEAASKMAQETAAKLLKTYSGNGKLAPLLDATLARFDALGDGLGSASGEALNMSNATGWINTNLMQASSGLLFFGDRVQKLDAPLSGAQLASAALSDQILALRMNASRGTTDIAGLSEALANVNTETFMATMQGVLERLAGMFSGVLGDIASERISVREAALQIINPSVMSKGQIQRAIAEQNVGMPSNAGVVGAQSHLGAVSAEADRLQQESNWRQVSASDALSALRATEGARSSVAAQRDQLMAARQGQVDWINSLWDGGANSGYRYGKRKAWSDEAVVVIGQLDAQIAALVPQIQAYDSAVAAQQANYNAATAEAQQVSAALAAYTGQHLPWALQNAKNAQLAYVDSLQTYAIDASKATARLGKLREETVRYYESQKALADLMTTSASTLRQTVADYRYNQLAPEQQFRSLETQFNSAYSLALSTSGETLAGYADKMSGLLGPLLDKMAEAGYGADQSAIATYLARAEAVAGRVEGLSPTNYAADSLAMLGQIDSTLAALEEGSKSAERIIADAINEGRDQTVNGLRQVVNALTGNGVAAFASGGTHTGGLRLVGENGPELEVTGPSRIYSASQTAAMLGGGSGAMVAELRALRAELRALRAESQATAGHTAKTARHLDRMSADGLLVRTDSDTPLATVPA